MKIHIHIPSLLKDAGLKMTPARKEILNVFSSDCKPISAEYIFDKLKSKKINLVTIYRTLISLDRAQIITRVDIRKDSVHYELAHHHHHHMVCTGCKRTESFETCGIEKLSQELLKKSSWFTSFDQHSLELFGRCKACSLKKNK